MITVLFNLKTDELMRAKVDDEAPDDREWAAVKVEDDGTITVCAWMRLASTGKWWWLAYPPGVARGLLAQVLEAAPQGFFTRGELKLLEAATRRARA